MNFSPLNLPKSTDFDIVFVIGLHKSGTSLLTEHISNDFFDVSRITNPTERGYGSTVHRYLTRECKVARQINESYRSYILSSSATLKKNSFSLAAMRDVMQLYLQRWPEPIVLKAPFFGYSLRDWLDAARAIRRRPCVCLAFRDLHDVSNEWRNAPFTRELLNQGELERLKNIIDLQIENARASAVEVRKFEYNQIVGLIPTQHRQHNHI